MKKYIKPLLMGALLATTVSCSDWLDVQQNTEKPADEMFDNYSGFKGALAGCYNDLASLNLYGQKLTYSDIESLAGLWYYNSSTSYTTTLLPGYYLSAHNYTHTEAESEIATIYGAFYNAILEVNTLIKNCAEKGHVIPDEKIRNVVEGEAYALRALLHFDVLRLFGQVPNNSTIPVSLPYSETTTKDEMPPYYSFDEYVAKLESDLSRAVSLLEGNDPVCDYSYNEIAHVGDETNFPDVVIDDDFMYYRQFRMNYWAVKALQARMYMYLGQKQRAHDLALEVINATTTRGNKVVSLTSYGDYGSRYYSSPSEGLFLVSYAELVDVTRRILLGDEDLQVSEGYHLIITENYYTSLFSGANLGSDIRYLNMWAYVQTAQGFNFRSLRKYYYESSNVSTLANKLELLPVIRLSEMYLIAVEGASTVAEANQLYSTYMESKNVLLTNPFNSLDEVIPELEREYRREFFGEGVMFYYYKRTNATQMWSKENVQVSESDYILPLPRTEYNPNN